MDELLAMATKHRFQQVMPGVVRSTLLEGGRFVSAGQTEAIRSMAMKLETGVHRLTEESRCEVAQREEERWLAMADLEAELGRSKLEVARLVATMQRLITASMGEQAKRAAAMHKLEVLEKEKQCWSRARTRIELQASMERQGREAAEAREAELRGQLDSSQRARSELSHVAVKLEEELASKLAECAALRSREMGTRSWDPDARANPTPEAGDSGF
eukprot:TRINITY_DN24477_c0_g1_i3.p2 TRINITY_DN24477_c0_g1~~TRINITY_DN24477_c0_g1_i3.p2  ORF type:complete len:216 (+),score=60.81 TRINITY_DN24477_c0_g1_i3:171-818(+)